MSLGPRILFHSSNRRGLGHLMRGLNIATELKELDPQCDISFYVRGRPPNGFTDLDIRFFLGRDDNRCSWQEVARSFNPSVVIYDTMLPPSLEDMQAAPNACFVYVMRKCAAERQAEVFQHWSMDHMRLIIVPHEEPEFAHPLPRSLAAKTHYVGAIVRRPDSSKSQALVAKYGLSSDAFTLLSTPGGGGFVDEAKSFFDVIKNVHQRVIYEIPGLQHIVIQGPMYPGKIEPCGGMRVVDSEPDLVHLLPDMDLVISAGGYNTVTEIRIAKTAAVFLPSPRTHDDQLERVSAMQAAGLARVCTDSSGAATADAIAKLCTSTSELSRMRKHYAQDSLTIGNETAARLILEQCSDVCVS